jgi:rhodanese-related sulfurtransferase
MYPVSPNSRVVRFGWSAALRLASAGVQLWGGYAGREMALVVKAGEELTDALTFGAVAVEAGTARQGLTRRARRIALYCAAGAASLATAGTLYEIWHDGFAWLRPLGGFSLKDHEVVAATIALGLSLIVFIINMRGRTSRKTSDRFAFRDSVRDFVIPASVVLLAALRAPHLAEYLFELGGVAYGWYNVAQLFAGWRIGQRPAK